MPTDAADPMEEDADSGTATFGRKRPHDVISRDDASNAGVVHSNPRKRAKHAGKLGYQDVRDFVPVGASFSTSAVPVDEAENSGHEGSQAETSLKSEDLSDHEVFKVSESDVAEQENALVGGRRLLITDLPPDITEEDLKQFFKGYSMWVTMLSLLVASTDDYESENIWFPDPMGDSSRLVTFAQTENVPLNGDSIMTNPLGGTTISRINDGRRLYVGNIPYAATVEDLGEFFRGFSL